MKNNLLFSFLLVLVTFLAFNINSYAVTMPELRITSGSYVSGSKMTKEEITNVEIGRTLQLYAVICYGNEMYNPNNPDSLGWYVQEANLNGVTWTSNNPSIAKVDATGRVTGVLEGKASITARYNGESAIYEINVKPQSETVYTGIGFVRGMQEQSMKVNEEFSFMMYLYNIPDTEKGNIKFTIDNENIAKIKGVDLCNWADGSGKGVIMANTKFLAPGKASITASIRYNGKTYTDSYTFTVTGNNNLSISTGEKNDNSSSLEVGDSMQLSPKFDGNKTNEEITSNDVKWSSSDEDVAIIDNHGVVTATGKGNATITAEYEDDGEKVKATYNLEITGSRNLNSKDSSILPVVENIIILLIGVFLGVSVSMLIYRRKD